MLAHKNILVFLRVNKHLCVLTQTQHHAFHYYTPKSNVIAF